MGHGSLFRTVDPAIEPVTLQFAKSHLRLDDANEDALVLHLIKAAREWCENRQNRSYITQTWRMKLDNFPGEGDGYIELPRPPLLTVSSITYVDVNGTTQTLATSVYSVNMDSFIGCCYLKYQQIYPSTQSIPFAVTITYTAGYGATAATTPTPVKQAMLMLIGHWYANREAVITGTISKDIEFSVKSLLGQERTGIIV